MPTMTVTPKQARESLSRFVNSACGADNPARISILVRSDYDDDILLATFIDEAERAFWLVESLEKQLEENREWVKNFKLADYMKPEFFEYPNHPNPDHHAHPSTAAQAIALS